MPPTPIPASSGGAAPNSGSGFLNQSEEEEPSSLPVYRCINPRSKVDPEQIDVNRIAYKCKANHIDKKHRRSDQVPYPVPKSLPIPKYPMTLMWNPAIIKFELHYDRVVNRLRLYNSCIRPIYIQIYGLWDQSARVGASWFCRPRTRIFLAPGMISYLAIIATPREESPISLARIGLQLSATHMRDTVVGYFIVPIDVKFGNYKMQNCEENCLAEDSNDGASPVRGSHAIISDTDEAMNLNKL